MHKVIVPLADGFEEIEAFAPVDLLRRAGVEVTLASLAGHRHATGRSGITVNANATLDEVAGEIFNMVFLPGGVAVKALRADPRVPRLIMQHYDLGAWIAAICAAPTLLNDCGLLSGRRYTAHFSVAEELPKIVAGQPVVTDGRITTSRGAGTALEFGLHLVGLLCGTKMAREISHQICR